MIGPVIRRRAALLAMLAGLSACATPTPPPPVVPSDPDPDPERVYSPGPIPWENLTEEHRRRARQGLTRLGEAVPDDATLQARWMVTPPAQQRFLIRRPAPPSRPVARGRGTPARGSTPARPSTPPPTRRPPPPRRAPPR
jgi:hypothetical protein